MIRLLVWLLFNCLKGGDITMAIAAVYVTLILAGRRTFVQVPTPIQSQVEADLAAIGLGTDGMPLGGE